MLFQYLLTHCHILSTVFVPHYIWPSKCMSEFVHVYHEWWAGLGVNDSVKGTSLIIPRLRSCVYSCVGWLRWETFSTPPRGLLQTKSNTADRAPAHALSAYTHWGPRLRATLHPGPPLWSCRNTAAWWGTSLGSWWGIRRRWLSLRRTQTRRILNNDSSWKLGKGVSETIIVQMTFHCFLMPLRVALNVGFFSLIEKIF